MVTLSLEKKNCCGCASCAQRCPTHSITMRSDEEGFLYPFVDRSLCLDCGLCDKVCPVLNPYDLREPLRVMAAENMDDSRREESSSGGIFYLLAERTVKDGGVVFGARFDESWQVVIDYAEDLTGIRRFMGSKYVQARTADSFVECERFLKTGHKVLFSGTSCQIAGLRRFLQKDYDNLFTVDVVCHGVPSPGVWDKFLRDVADGRHIGAVCSYDQETGSSIYSSCFRSNPYMKGFLSDLILRPSCHHCPAKEGRSQSDITLADFWGIEKSHPHMDDDTGTSLVLVNTGKGSSLLEGNRLKYEIAGLEEALPYNGGLNPSPRPHPKRERFFRKLKRAGSVSDLILECISSSRRGQIKCVLSGYKWRIVRMKDMLKRRKHPAMSVESVSFRDKSQGWKNYRMTVHLKQVR